MSVTTNTTLNLQNRIRTMKKIKISVAAILLAGCSLTLTSCLGSFALTNRVITWNRQVSNKFVNELVFFAFWILPVYEVVGMADLLVINSIEFWSGRNPMTASMQTIDTEHGRYQIACDGRGYDIMSELTGEKLRLDFVEDSQTWGVTTADGEFMPFMTYLDNGHVRMRVSDGVWSDVELSQQGLMAYRNCVEMQMAIAK